MRNDQYNPLRSSEPPQLAPRSACPLPPPAAHICCTTQCTTHHLPTRLPAGTRSACHHSLHPTALSPLSSPLPPRRHKKVKLRVLKFYKVDDSGKVQRLRKVCPQCGPGIFMATHFNRVYCGKCHLVSAAPQCHLLLVLARLVGRAGPWVTAPVPPATPVLSYHPEPQPALVRQLSRFPAKKLASTAPPPADVRVRQGGPDRLSVCSPADARLAQPMRRVRPAVPAHQPRSGGASLAAARSLQAPLLVVLPL